VKRDLTKKHYMLWCVCVRALYVVVLYVG
jgi:hypothetical protein